MKISDLLLFLEILRVGDGIHITSFISNKLFLKQEDFGSHCTWSVRQKPLTEGRVPTTCFGAQSLTKARPAAMILPITVVRHTLYHILHCKLRSSPSSHNLTLNFISEKIVCVLTLWCIDSSDSTG